MKKQWKQLVGSGVFDSVSSRMKFWYQKLLIFHKLLYTVLQMWRNDEDDAFPKIYWVSIRNQTWATAGRSNQDLLTHCGSILRSRILVATHYTELGGSLCMLPGEWVAREAFASSPANPQQEAASLPAVAAMAWTAASPSGTVRVRRFHSALWNFL